MEETGYGSGVGGGEQLEGEGGIVTPRGLARVHGSVRPDWQQESRSEYWRRGRGVRFGEFRCFEMSDSWSGWSLAKGLVSRLRTHEPVSGNGRSVSEGSCQEEYG